MKRMSRAALEEARRRAQAVEQAQERFSSYMLGVVQQAGVDPETYGGFDDQTGEIIVREAEGSD